MNPEVLEAIEVLSSLGDFLQFKEVMIAKKAQMNGEDVGKALDVLKNKNLGMMEVVDIQAHMDKIAELTKAVDQADGWNELINEGGATGHTKQMEDGDTALRVTAELDLAPKYAIEMFMAGNDEMP